MIDRTAELQYYEIHGVDVTIDDALCKETTPAIRVVADFQNSQSASIQAFESEATQGTCRTSFQLPQPTDLATGQMLVVEVYDNTQIVARCPFHTRDLGGMDGSSSAVLAVMCEDRGTAIEVGYRGPLY